MIADQLQQMLAASAKPNQSLHTEHSGMLRNKYWQQVSLTGAAMPGKLDVMGQEFAMSRRPHKNDISIGDDRWITFGDLKNGQEQAIELDPILARVMPFLDLLETECVADCCGIDAYNLWPDNIKNAIAKLNPQDRECLISNLAQVQTEVKSMPTDTVVSNRMNQYFRKAVFLEVFSHVSSVAAAELVKRD